MKILMVEDDATTLAVMARLLRRTSHAVTTADGLAKALEAADAGAYDLVISDIGQPDGSGLDLMPKIRARSTVPGIALSGFGMERDIHRSREAGFAVHLTKPVDFSKLEATIRRVVAGGP